MRLLSFGYIAWTNHQSSRLLTKALLFTQKMENPRWYDILPECQSKFSYLPGAKNGIADALSRRSDLQPETKFFHDLSVTSFDDTSFSLALSEVTLNTELIVSIKTAYAKDREVQAILAAIKRRANQRLSVNTARNTDATPKSRVVVPNDSKLRMKIISECHDSNYGGHPGAERTYLSLARSWYWSKMSKSIQKFIADCESCRRNKPRLTKPPGLLEPLRIPDERWRSISIDFITDLPKTEHGFDSIWVVVDRLTKRCHFVSTTKKVTAEGVACLFIDNVWKHHGMPTNIVSDRDRKFISSFWQCIFKSIGAKLTMTVAHRAQGDGQTERVNRTLEEYLRCFVGPLQDDWDIHLANAEFAVNSTVNSSTKLAPFEVDLGYVPLNPLQIATESLEAVPVSRCGTEFHERQAAILLRYREALSESQERMRDVYDRNRVEQVFNVGDRVYLSTKHLDPKHTGLPNSTKFGPKWVGPYTVVCKVHNHAYELNIQAGNKLHPVFNTGSLKPYKEPSRLSNPNDVILADGSV
ncbi:Polyprotein [Phytophthora palmivora]|uniref:Polyprotein n=1 Tax=Phytophthora palmivora TaxID=4796 RepID=A0A2P4XNJ8_9STRA|nr:Polyprotein [Phytophthora palmivora]